MSKPLTVERFIAAFRLDMGWECKPGTLITNDLTEFARANEGDTRDILELLVIFKMSHNIAKIHINNTAAIEAL
jgi:hypothetical protein